MTGGAGFIGSNFVYYMLKKYEDILLVDLDKLTYAGNLENLKGVDGDPRHVFVKGDICDKELVSGLFEKYDFDYVINFAAESHVDRSIYNPELFVQTNILGTVNLLQRAKEAWYDSENKTWKQGKKYLQVSTDEVYGALGADGFFTETTPINPHSPYSSSSQCIACLTALRQPRIFFSRSSCVIVLLCATMYSSHFEVPMAITRSTLEEK